MEANPVGLVVAGIAALGAILYYAWEKSEVFRGGVIAMWEVTKTVVGQIVQAFKGLWNVLAGIHNLDKAQIEKGFG